MWVDQPVLISVGGKASAALSSPGLRYSVSMSYPRWCEFSGIWWNSPSLPLYHRWKGGTVWSSWTSWPPLFYDQVVVQTPLSQMLYLLSVVCLIIVSCKSFYSGVSSELHYGVGGVDEGTVVGREDYGWRCQVPYPDILWSVSKKVHNPRAEWGGKIQVDEFLNQFMEDYGVKGRAVSWHGTHGTQVRPLSFSYHNTFGRHCYCEVILRIKGLFPSWGVKDFAYLLVCWFP